MYQLKKSTGINMTLLKKLIQDTSNPISKIINITNSTHIKDFTGNEILIHDTNNKINYYENLSREIFIQTMMSHYVRESNMPYSKETLCENQKRADLTFKFANTIAHCIEFKVITSKMAKSTLNTKIEQAKEQIEGKYLRANNKTGFATVVLMDIERVCLNPELINLFLNYPHDLNNLDSDSVIEKFGLYIETYSYDSKNGHRGESSSYLPKICFYSKQEIGYDTINKCKVINSLILPSNSGVNGVKNVRDIKNPYINKAKAKQVISIFETILNAFTDGRKDELYLNGQQKCFITVGTANSIVYEDISKERCIVSTNAALVDGQNSIDSVRQILSVLEDKIHDKGDKLTRAIKLRSQEIMRKSNGTFNINVEQDINNLIHFIKQELYYGISILTAENENKAFEYAKNRNQSIQVSDNELKLAPLTYYINMFNYYMQDEHNVIMTNPQRITTGLREQNIESSTNVLDHFAYYNAYKSIISEIEGSKLKTGNDILGSVKTRISTEQKHRYITALTKLFTVQSDKSVEDTIKERKCKIVDLQDNIDNIEDTLEYLPSEKRLKQESRIQEDYIKIDDENLEIEKLTKRLNSFEKNCNMDLLKTHKDLNGLILNISSVYDTYMVNNIDLHNVVSKFVNKIQNNKAYIFFRLIMKYKEEFNLITDDIIYKEVEQYAKRIFEVKTQYDSFNITVFRTDKKETFKQHSFQHNSESKVIRAGNACDYVFGLTDVLIEEVLVSQHQLETIQDEEFVDIAS